MMNKPNPTFTAEWRNRHNKILSAYNEALKQKPGLTEKDFIKEYISKNDIRSDFRFLFVANLAGSPIDEKNIVETDIYKIIANMTTDEWHTYLRTKNKRIYPKNLVDNETITETDNELTQKLHNDYKQNRLNWIKTHNGKEKISYSEWIKEHGGF